MLSRSSKTVSPSRVRPPGAEKALRPSSAERASKSRDRDQVGDRLRLENDRVDARLEGARACAIPARSDRLAARRARCRAWRRRSGCAGNSPSRRHRRVRAVSRKAGEARPLVAEVAVLGGAAPRRSPLAWWKPALTTPAFSAGRDDRVDRPGAVGQGGVGRRFDIAGASARTSVARASACTRRRPATGGRAARPASTARRSDGVVEVVGGRRAALAADPDRDVRRGVLAPAARLKSLAAKRRWECPRSSTVTAASSAWVSRSSLSQMASLSVSESMAVRRPPPRY